MKRNIGIYLALVILFSFCHFFSKNEKNTARDYDYINEQDLEDDIYDPETDYPVDIPSIPEIVRPEIVDGKGSIDIYKYAGQEVRVEIELFGYKTLTAQITSEDPNANIRISQMILPDQTTDGPFGREITYDLPRDGIYTLLIHENMMAGDPWTGYFRLDFEVTK